MPAGASRFWQGHPCRQGSSGPAKNKGRLNPQDPPRKSWHGNCEPNIRQVRTPGWLVDDSEDAAILLRGTPMRKWGKCRGFVWAQVTPCTIFSCYISPNITTMLREAPGRSCKLRADARRTGDGSRGFQRQNFHVGFYRGRRQGAHAGGLGCSDEPGRHEPRRAHVREGRKQGWHVMEAGTTTSDHLPIEFTIRASHSLPEVGRPARGWRWTDSKKDELTALLRRELEHLSSPSVADLQQRTEELCDRVLPKRGSLRSTTRAVFWWTGEKIRAAKARAWDRLRETVENDPWGKGYKIATGKLGRRTSLSLEERREAVARLFPTRPLVKWMTPEVGDLEPFTVDELWTAATKLRSGKAPGPDGIPPEVIRLMVEVA
ncbi:hypothetical protein GEV33_005323 [Tenebrio molitor]|uniref:Reverse transcriptase n=1 Tax=Tenebrio molitor TaxID=7067 RepID=A0A8J6HNJ4_TENMO|nr:hypothetical protein GEV33_005323 [Tenebrio molitor]